jgi:hypothetical protein
VEFLLLEHQKLMVVQILLQQLKCCEDKQKNGHVSVIFKDRHKLLGTLSSALLDCTQKNGLRLN